MSLSHLTPYDLMEAFYGRLGQALVQMEAADYKQVVGIIDNIRTDMSRYTAGEIDNEPLFLARGALQILDRARLHTRPCTRASLVLREVGMALEDMMMHSPPEWDKEEGE